MIIDWTPIIVAGVVAIPSTIASIGAFIIAMKNQKTLLEVIMRLKTNGNFGS